jgi:hypothetical protein
MHLSQGYDILLYEQKVDTQVLQDNNKDLSIELYNLYCYNCVVYYILLI